MKTNRLGQDEKQRLYTKAQAAIKYYRQRLGQDTMKLMYAAAQGRIKHHPEYAAEQEEIINKQLFFKTEREALDFALNQKGSSSGTGYQIWAKIGRDDEYFYLQDYYIVTDDNRIKTAAEYVGMVMLFWA